MTWIDYDRFDELIADYYDKIRVIDETKGLTDKERVDESNKAANSLRGTDYMRKTPSWALYQSRERGFDPAESRFRRNKQGVLVENEYKATDSGCG